MDKLRAAGCERISQEHGSGASRARPVLTRLLGELATGLSDIAKWGDVPGKCKRLDHGRSDSTSAATCGCIRHCLDWKTPLENLVS